MSARKMPRRKRVAPYGPCVSLDLTECEARVLQLAVIYLLTKRKSRVVVSAAQRLDGAIRRFEESALIRLQNSLLRKKVRVGSGGAGGA